jgi:hypothetical protein
MNYYIKEPDIMPGTGNLLNKHSLSSLKGQNGKVVLINLCCEIFISPQIVGSQR